MTRGPRQSPSRFVGMRSGKLTVLGDPPPHWKATHARCDCGRVVVSPLANLVLGRKKSCGTRACKVQNNLTGRTFGQLTVLGLSDQNEARQWGYRVRCSCGETRVVQGKYLLSGNTKSCGCLRVTTGQRLAQGPRDREGRFV